MLWDASNKMVMKRLTGNKGWDINDPFTTLPPLNHELQPGDLCVVYYNVSCYVPKKTEESNTSQKAVSWGWITSLKKPNAASSSTSAIEAVAGEGKPISVNLNLLGAVRLAFR